MCDRDDDHYIPDIHNAHIDTRDFEVELARLVGDSAGQELDEKSPWAAIHELISARLDAHVDEPTDDTVICRYLSPIKFLWLVNRFTIRFTSAGEFEDASDCALPADYDDCVQKFLNERRVVPIAWDDYSLHAREKWLVSSWTELKDHHDDYLLWSRYAEGRYGVGITLRYGQLRDLLNEQVAADGSIAPLISGRVTYGSPLRIPPFFKRRMFGNEKEVRFVCRSELLHSFESPIGVLKERICLRFSPDTPKFHRDAIMQTWTRAGGNGCFEISGE
jgi:hypothetical protein